MNMSEDTFTYGCELEWSDIDRSIDIPQELGSWEGPKLTEYYLCPEIDIVNTQGKWRGVGTDPLCLTCPVGGEIHTVPSPDIESQFFRILRLMDIFPKLNVACPNHGHIHVHVPELKNNLQIIKNFFAWLKVNEEDIIRYCCGYDDAEYHQIMDSDLQDWVKDYLVVGDGKHINPDLYEYVNGATSTEQIFDALKLIECKDWDWCGDKFVDVRSHRTAVNMYNLLKGDTIEFRIFRASLNPFEIYSCLRFVESVVHEAILGTQGRGVKEILNDNHYEFPKLNFDYELAKGWQDTRQTKGRCGPFKKSFSSATVIKSDPIVELVQQDISFNDLSDFDRGLVEILRICSSAYANVKVNQMISREEIESCRGVACTDSYSAN